MINWIKQRWQRMRYGTGRSFFSSSFANPSQWLIDWFRGDTRNDSGVSVNGRTVLGLAPVWYSVSRISGHVGYLPLTLFQRLGERRKRRATDHPAYRLLKKRPNSLMGASVFKETLQQHALLWGNGRAGIIRDNRSTPMELVVLLPDRTETILMNKVKFHVVNLRAEDGRSQTQAKSVLERAADDPERSLVVPDVDCLHIVGLGFDGLVGYDVITFAKNSFGLGLAAEKHSNRHFRQFAKPGVVLEAPPGAFRDEAKAQEFMDKWNSFHQGLDNVDRTGLLRNGVQAKTMQMTGRDAQWIEQRTFQRQEVALWFLLESILGDDSSVSYGSLEQKNTDYLSRCLNRWLVKWEEECQEKLLTEEEKRRDSHYFKFNQGALLRAVTTERYQAYATALQNKFLTRNEVRDLEDLDETDGGDIFENPAITPGDGSQPPANNRILGTRGPVGALANTNGHS